MQRLIVYGKHNFAAEESDEISFKAGEPIIVLEKDEQFGDGWWTGQNMNGDVGIFPMNFVTLNETPNSAKSNLDLLLEDLETVEFPEDNVYQWDSNRVAEFISSIGFDDLKHLFIEHDINGTKLLDSTIASLRKIGVDVLSNRVKIMHEVITLKETHKRDDQSDTTEIIEINEDTNTEPTKSNIDSVINKYELLPEIPEHTMDLSISPTKEEILDSQIRLSDQMIKGMTLEARYSDPLSEENPPDVAYSDTSSQDIPRMTNLSESEFDFEFGKTLDEIKLAEVVKENSAQNELKELPLIPEEDSEIHEEIQIMDLYDQKPLHTESHVEKTTSLNINTKMHSDFKMAPIKQKRSSIAQSMSTLTRKLSLRKESNAIPVPQFDDSNLRAYLNVKAESEMMFHRKKCILKGSSIYIFKKDDQQISQIVHMNDPSSILPSDKPNSFMIKDTINQTKTIFTCSSQLEMISWVNKLVRATQPPIHKSPLIPIKNANRGHLKDGIMGKTVKLQEIKRPTSFMGKAKFMPERYKRLSMQE
ncbi:polar growth protein [Boothiomyces macroporosus]|uniref:Polar growth protein n=1 Tax=Boothiomyces macroporosus TaxID=261099 RepID=A0AAD5UBE7_9FUNG|nr:polar growth protein [Boothiomyces macroporosus]